MKTIRSILIANRGEIASRIIRTCRLMGIRSIAIYSDADQNAPYVTEADLAVPLGGNSPEDTYLNVDKIIDAALRAGAEAIHPGYGFLAENASFARRCAAEELTFIGPRPEAIEVMGSKSQAKALLADHNVPLIPGYNGKEQSAEKFIQEAAGIGFPVLLKASAGGGGKGMRIVNEADRLEEAYASAKSEALNAFGDDHLILEKYFEEVRHVEFQIFGDQHGKVIHLLERECSIQRRYQKVLEESPSPVLTPELREKMGAAAVAVAKALNYDNAGTVEFILAPDGSFYFLEVNTRLQVEHPVTEMITGLDLVQMQIESAEGRHLKVSQEEVQAKGYAIELRLYAEDPANDFSPATGKVLRWKVPKIDGLRVESAVRTGSEISVFYDPMIAKLIIHGEDRPQTFRKMAYLLENLQCLGVTTNREFLYSLVCDPKVQSGDYHTHFLNDFDTSASSLSEQETNIALTAATLSRWQQREERRVILRNIPSGWRNSDYQPQLQKLKIGEAEYLFRYRQKGETFEVEVGEWKRTARISGGGSSALLDIGESLRTKGGGDSALLDISYSLRTAGGGNSALLDIAESLRSQDGGGLGVFITEDVFRYIPMVWDDDHCHLLLNGRNIVVELVPRFPDRQAELEKGGLITPMPCQVLKILVEVGQQVEKDDPVAVLVSMKMENTLYSDQSGVVEEIYAKEGQNLEAKVLIMKLKADTE